jgi:hypothetical protein
MNDVNRHLGRHQGLETHVSNNQIICMITIIIRFINVMIKCVKIG